MLKVAPCKKILIAEGSSVGMPCILVDCQSKNGEEKTLDDLFTEILNFSKEKVVLVKGFLSKSPEIKPLLAGLVGKGKFVIFMTDVSESIGPVRPLMNLKIILSMIPPNEKVNEVNTQTLTLLKEMDEIKITIKNISDYRNAKKYLADRLISLPTIFFSIHPKYKEPLEFVKEYLQDSETFQFKHRISKPLSL